MLVKVATGIGTDTSRLRWRDIQIDKYRKIIDNKVIQVEGEIYREVDTIAFRFY